MGGNSIPKGVKSFTHQQSSTQEGLAAAFQGNIHNADQYMMALKSIWSDKTLLLFIATRTAVAQEN